MVNLLLGNDSHGQFVVWNWQAWPVCWEMASMVSLLFENGIHGQSTKGK